MKNSNLPLLSSRSINTPASPIRSFTKYARIAEEKGVIVNYLNIGQPDLPAPIEFFEGLKAYDKLTLKYESSEGSIDLREAWVKFLNQNDQLNLDLDNILITTGASEALVFTFMVCCDPGAEVIVFEPTYANYMGFAATAGINLTGVRLNGKLDIESVEERLTSNTRAVLICNPNNPDGYVFPEEELKELINFCDENRLFLIVDETYRNLVFDGSSDCSILKLSQSPNIIVIDSISKRFNLCGARIGNILSYNQDFLGKVLRIAQARLASPTIAQFATTHMLENLPTDYLETQKKTYQQRRDVLANDLERIPSVEHTKTYGSFYTLVTLPVEDSSDFVKFLLNDFSLNGETLFVAPASGFYISSKKGKNQIRIAAVLEDDKLQQSMQILEAGLTAYQSQ